MYEPVQTESTGNLASMFLFWVFNIFPDYGGFSALES